LSTFPQSSHDVSRGNNSLTCLMVHALPSHPPPRLGLPNARAKQVSTKWHAPTSGTAPRTGRTQLESTHSGGKRTASRPPWRDHAGSGFCSSTRRRSAEESPVWPAREGRGRTSLCISAQGSHVERNGYPMTAGLVSVCIHDGRESDESGK
jgi:hypothetical protein